MHRGSARWWVIVVVLPALAVLGAFVPLIAFRIRYPDPIAVHWAFSGLPNGEMSFPLYVALLAVGMLLAWFALVAGSRTSMPSAPLAAVTYFIIGLVAAVNVQIVVANLDAVTWQAAEPMSMAVLVGVIVAGLIAGLIGWLSAGGSHGVPVDEPMTPGATPVESWSGSASNGWFAAFSVVPILFAVLLEPLWTVLMIAVAIVVVAFASVRVAVDSDGVTVEIGPFGWPSQHISVGEITGAEAFEVRPMAYGGYGYRVRSGVRAFIIRGGPAIRIGRATGPDTLVTVDDAPIGAVSIAALARR
jgi:hypothetical protein